MCFSGFSSRQFSVNVISLSWLMRSSKARPCSEVRPCAVCGVKSSLTSPPQHPPASLGITMRTLTGLLRFTHLLHFPHNCKHLRFKWDDFNDLFNILSWFPWGFLLKEALNGSALFSRSASPFSSPPHLLEVVAPATGKRLVLPREMQAIPCIYMCIAPAWKFLISLTSIVDRSSCLFLQRYTVLRR